jgi:hypothetical protein
MKRMYDSLLEEHFKSENKRLFYLVHVRSEKQRLHLKQLRMRFI